MLNWWVFLSKRYTVSIQEAINSGDNSHLISVPAGTILADSLYSTPLFRGEGSIAQIPGTEGIPEGLEVSLVLLGFLPCSFGLSHAWALHMRA